MSKPIEGCPQPETPIRERAWTAEQETAREYTAEELESHCGKLWDSQWTNVVNHDNCYAGWDKDDAINHAVKLTEQYIRKNFDAFAATLRQQAERAGGAVSDEEVERLELIRRKAINALDDAEPGRMGNRHDDCLVGMRAALEAADPLLRAPAEQGGRVDGFEAWFGRNYPATNDGANSGGPEESAIRDCARQAWQAALAQNAQGEGKPCWAVSRSMHSYYTFDEELARQAEFDGASVHRIHAERARVPDTAISTAAMQCARYAYGYWKGDSTGSAGALSYFDNGLPNRDRHAAPFEKIIRQLLAAAPSQPEDAA